MSTRPGTSRNRAQRFWEFFIFGLVFTALFLFWFIIKAGLVVGFFTGALAGLCFTAAWFHWRTRVDSVSQEEAVAAAPAQPARTEREDSIEPATTAEIAPVAENDAASAESLEQAEPIKEQPAPEGENIAPVAMAETPLLDRQESIEPVAESEAAPVESLEQAEPEPIEGHPAAESENIVPVAMAETPFLDQPESIQPSSEITKVDAEGVGDPTSAIEGSLDEPIALADVQQDAVAQPALVVPKNLEIEAYCVKCRVNRIMDNPQLFGMKNERHALRGVCSVCGSGLFRIISQKQEAEWSPQNTAQ